MALNSTGRRTRGAAAGTRTKPRPKKKKVAKNGEEGEKKKRAPNPNNAFHAPMLLSPQLSEVVFETELSRPVGFIGVFEADC
jgi:chromatin remodeling complex protein RSC6